jgi:peptide/nickel transport system permease protein
MRKRKGMLKRLRGSPFTFFLAKKVAFLLVAVFISFSLVFILPRLMNLNPADVMVYKLSGEVKQYAEYTIMKDVYARLFGIYEPVQVQYIDFWKSVVTMNFGPSFMAYPTSVSALVMQALPWTLALIIPVLLCGFVIGNRIGSRAAYYRGKLDTLLYYLSLYMFQAPYYWFALIIMYIFGVGLKWFPMFGAYSTYWVRPILNFNWFLDAVYHYALPFLSLLGVGIGGWAIGMRAMTVYEMESDYMQYSKQLGFTKGKLREYVVHNAILPNFTWIPVAIAGLVGQTLLVEYVFVYPGLGTLMYRAVTALDYPLIEACFVMTVLIVLVGNFVADIVYGVLDPRIATGYVGEK